MANINSPAGKADDSLRLATNTPVLAKTYDELVAENTALQDENIRLLQAAHTNQLTGITSREGFEAIVSQLSPFVSENNYSGHGAIAFVDVDQFKQVNDTHGHNVGDAVLKYIANQLNEKISEHEHASDSRIPIYAQVVHLSGDEYAIVFVEAVVQDLRSHESPVTHDRRGDSDRFGNEIDRIMYETAQAIANEPLVIEDAEGTIEIQCRLSYGIGTFRDPDPASINEARTKADSEMYGYKTGRTDFSKAYRENEQVRNFFNAIPGFEVDKAMPWVQDLKDKTRRPASEYFSTNDPEFREISGLLSERAMKWVLPALSEGRTQAPDALGR